jgi:hypothetical protein
MYMHNKVPCDGGRRTHTYLGVGNSCIRILEKITHTNVIHAQSSDISMTLAWNLTLAFAKHTQKSSRRSGPRT